LTIVTTMQLEEYISELLYDHDCVIVPDFGGFIGNYAPARLDEVKHLFEPPHKKIIFNKGLIQNDGLLANHLSIREQIAYNEALKRIAGEVSRYRNELKESKRIVLDNIGVLYIDEAGNLVFQADEKVNYLPEAFGLSAFYRLPVVNEEAEKKEPVVVQLHKERSRLRPYAVAAAIGALIASTFWFTVNETNLVNYSSFNLFGKKEPVQYVFNSTDNISKINTVPVKDTLNIVVTEPVKAPEITSSPYHIVAGCFRIYENAQNMVSILQKKNVEASIIGKNPQGLYIVGCGGYSSYNEAEAHLDTFRKNVQENAWVFKK